VSGKLVNLSAVLRPAGGLVDAQLRAIGDDGMNAPSTRPLIGGGKLEMRVSPTPDTDDPSFPRASFPKGTYMAGVVEGFENGRVDFLWIGTRGYRNALEAAAAAIPHFEEILKMRKG
jgi:hypothetical protein